MQEVNTYLWLEFVYIATVKWYGMQSQRQCSILFVCHVVFSVVISRESYVTLHIHTVTTINYRYSCL